VSHDFFFPDLQTVIPRPNVGLFFNVPWEFLPRQYCIHVPCILSLFFFFFFGSRYEKYKDIYYFFIFTWRELCFVDRDWIHHHTLRPVLPPSGTGEQFLTVRTYLHEYKMLLDVCHHHQSPKRRENKKNNNVSCVFCSIMFFSSCVHDCWCWWSMAGITTYIL
jgi:hypothetical protein